MKLQIVDQTENFKFAILKRTNENFEIHVEECGCVTAQGDAGVPYVSMPWFAGFSVVPHILVYCRQHTQTWFDEMNVLNAEGGTNEKTGLEKQFTTDMELLLAHWIEGHKRAFIRKPERWCFETDEAFRGHVRTADVHEGVDFVLKGNGCGLVASNTYPFYFPIQRPITVSLSGMLGVSKR